METTWLWHRMGTIIVVVAHLCVLASAFLRYYKIHDLEIWVDMSATLMTTTIGSMGLSGVNALKRRKGLRELFSKNKPVEEEPVEEEPVEHEEPVEEA